MGPAETIAKLKADRSSWSPAQILDDLAALPPLPDEYDPQWQEDEAWEQAYKLIALSDLVAEHRLTDGIGLVLDRMAHGDPGETMRGMRHALEATVQPDWSRLAEICVSRTQSPRIGTRYWAVDQLGVIREPASVPALIELLDDSSDEVAVAACRALMMVCQTNGEVRATAVDALRAAAERRPELAQEIEADLDQIEEHAEHVVDDDMVEDEQPIAPAKKTTNHAAASKPRKAAANKPTKVAAKKPAKAAAKKPKKAAAKKPANAVAKKAAAKKAAAKKAPAKKPARTAAKKPVKKPATKRR